VSEVDANAASMRVIFRDVADGDESAIAQLISVPCLRKINNS
jgi:hypothetical protein